MTRYLMVVVTDAEVVDDQLQEKVNCFEADSILTGGEDDFQLANARCSGKPILTQSSLVPCFENEVDKIWTSFESNGLDWGRRLIFCHKAVALAIAESLLNRKLRKKTWELWDAQVWVFEVIYSRTVGSYNDAPFSKEKK